MGFSFRVIHSDSGSRARLGGLTAGGPEVLTPAFMPVGTRGVVKTVSPEEVWGLGYRLVPANAYHLYLQAGPRVGGTARGPSQVHGLARFHSD